MRKNYIKPTNSIPPTHKKLGRMTTKLPTSRAQILRTANYFSNLTNINLTWHISALDLSSTNKVLKLSLENDKLIKTNTTKQSITRHGTVNLLP
jgi:hypothetical protein